MFEVTFTGFWGIKQTAKTFQWLKSKLEICFLSNVNAPFLFRGGNCKSREKQCNERTKIVLIQIINIFTVNNTLILTIQ